MSTFSTGNYSHQAAATSIFLNSVDLFFLMGAKSEVIKDVSSAKMPELLATVEVQIRRTFFDFSPFMYLLVRSEGYSVFLHKSLVD